MPVTFQGPSFCDNIFMFANIKFDIKSYIVSIKLSGQAKDAETVYSMCECNENELVVKKQNTVHVALQ